MKDHIEFLDGLADKAIAKRNRRASELALQGIIELYINDHTINESIAAFEQAILDIQDFAKPEIESQ